MLYIQGIGNMNLKCLFGLHKWGKFMGPENVGSGKFAQKYKCSVCNKIKRVVR